MLRIYAFGERLEKKAHPFGLLLLRIVKTKGNTINMFRVIDF